MKTMKVIDLLNKMANREEMPLMIKYEDKLYQFVEDSWKYYRIGSPFDSFEDDYYISKILNDEVEFIEDTPKEDKKIEKLNIEIQDKRTGNAYIRNEYGTKCYLTKHSKIIANKVNEIIDKINGE